MSARKLAAILLLCNGCNGLYLGRRDQVSIRGRLLILVLGAAIPLGVVGAAALRGIWQVSQAQLKDSMKQQAQLVGTAFERWADAQREPLTTITTALSDNQFDKTRLNDELRYIVQPRSDWIDLRVVDVSGHNVAVEPADTQPMPSALVDYLMTEMQRGNSWVLVTDRTRDESFPTFAIAQPLNNGGAIIARIDGTAIRSVFSHIELHNSAVIAVFDERGQILFRKPSPQFSANEEVSFAPLVSALGLQQSSVAEIDSPYDGVRRIYGLARAGHGQVAVVGIPSATLYESANRRFVTYVIFGVLALACALAAALLIARTIMRPIYRLQQAALDLGAGERNLRAPVTGTTETKDLGAAFNSMAAQIAEREKRLEELDLLKSEFVSSVSHELRTPLTTIKTLTHVLQRGESRPERLEHLRTIADECDREIDLVVNLLDLSRIESGALSLSPTRVNPAEVVVDCVMREQHAAESRRQNLRADLPVETPAVRADNLALRRVLCGLIENAIKYTPDGGEITVGIVSKINEVAIYVSDTGYGITSEDIPHIFEKFFRGHPPISDNDSTESLLQPGIGLGLYLARKIVGQMDGRLEVSSSGREGTTFTILLPRWHQGDVEVYIAHQEDTVIEEVTGSR